MPRRLDTDPNSPTKGLWIDDTAAKIPIITGGTPPISSVTDRPQDKLQQTYTGGGGVIIGDKGYIPGTSSIINDIKDTDKITYGTEDERNRRSSIADSASGLLGNLDEWNYKSELEKLKKMGSNFTAEEERALAAAEESEKAKWNAMISDAERERAKGLADTTITAGERGGFMNTQFAGAAALMPTQGRTWYGAGGQMEDIKSAYDRNINQLQEKRNAAVAAARAQAEAAIRGQKSEAYKRALELFQEAKKTDADLINLAKEKYNLINTEIESRQARIKSGLGDLEKIAAVGGEVPEKLKYNIDSYYGQGFTDKYKMASAAATKADKEESKVEAFKRITDILKNYPMGQKITIAGNEYEGIAENANNQVFKEEDAYGNVSFVTIDKTTGQIVNTASGGRIGAGRASSGSGGGADTKFWTDADQMRNELQQGESWGSVWNRLKAQYPGVPNETIDIALGKSGGWAEPGAYQTWAAGKKVGDTGLEAPAFTTETNQ